jgi:hypothetical protein
LTNTWLTDDSDVEKVKPYYMSLIQKVRTLVLCIPFRHRNSAKRERERAYPDLLRRVIDQPAD